MPDFTSSLYLGLRHESASLEPWSSLTTGVPAALRPPPASGRIEAVVASLVGTECALLYPSTLHAFVDVFASLARSDVELMIERGSYPIAAWAVEREAALGARVRVVTDVAAAVASARRRPVLVCDGVRPGLDRQPALRLRLERLRGARGLLVLDDTQALGVLGVPRARLPYGFGGGGSLRHAGATTGGAIVVASLAKALGAPIAFAAGPAAVVERLARSGQIRMHTSPPSAAALTAASAALRTNVERGERLRQRLAERVARLRAGARRNGVSLRGGLFPVQTLALPPSAAEIAHDRLGALGVGVVLHEDHARLPAVSLLVTAAHTHAEIDEASAALAHLRALVPSR